MDSKPKVLFLCTGNSARSQMAEAILLRYAGDFFEVFSAGLEPKGLNPYTVRVLEEQGYDLSGFTSKDLSTYLGKTNFSYIITVCANAEKRCPFFPGSGQRLHWPFDDPAEFAGTDAETLATFRRTRDQIQTKIQSWLAETGVKQDFIGRG